MLRSEANRLVSFESGIRFHHREHREHRESEYEGDIIQMQFMCEALLVGRFRQARSKNTMHFNRLADDVASEWLFLRRFLCALCVLQNSPL